MRRRGQTTTLQERIEISERAQAGQSDPDIARALGCSVYTVRKWRRRAQKGGRTELKSHMGRPARGSLGSFPEALAQTIRALREAHPGWGPESLLVELKEDPYWKHQPLASRSRIAAFLKEAGLTRRYQHHVELPQPPLQEATTPHQQWQMDAQGPQRVNGLGQTSLINVVDV